MCIRDRYRDTWNECGITYDRFIRTTDPDHVASVQDILRRMHAAGDVYFGSYGGLYCYGCERFYTEKELVDGKCPDHQVAPTYIEEENLSLIHISEPTRLLSISYAVFCLK